jgi:hypothetical protein
MQDKMPVRRLPIANLPGQYVLVDGDYDGELFSHHRVRVSTALGYPQISWTPALGVSRPKNPWGYVYLHRVVAGPSPPGMEVVYFKNDNKLDCRSANIGWTTRSVVALRRRQGSVRASISGYRGVHKIGRLYYASLNNTYLTAFGLADPAEAALIYDAAARERYGTKATLNFPDGQYEQSEGDSLMRTHSKKRETRPASGYFGVYVAQGTTNHWHVQLPSGYHGVYTDLTEAARVADYARLRLYGKGITLNLPDEKPLAPEQAKSRRTIEMAHNHYRTALKVGRSFRREYPGLTWTVMQRDGTVISRFATEDEAKAQLSQLTNG